MTIIEWTEQKQAENKNGKKNNSEEVLGGKQATSHTRKRGRV